MFRTFSNCNHVRISARQEDSCYSRYDLYSNAGKSIAANQSVTDSESLLTRSRRRIVFSDANDENRNPFVRAVDVGSTEHVQVEDGVRKIKGAKAARVVPAKHGAPEQRVSISPSKIDTHFKVRKSDIQVFEDGKGDRVSSPQTPRHRDAASKKVPITPRHRLLLNGNNVTPRSPKTPSNGATSVYSQARQLFSRCSNPGKLVKRDNERAELSNFIASRLEAKFGGCMYVSGPPGTGKSALVQEILQQETNTDVLKTSLINCMSIRSTKDLSGKLSEDLDLGEEDSFEKLRSCFTRAKGKGLQKYLVILDEIDQLVDLDLELLYNLFEWSMLPSSRLILIGIANALDLTDRFLPRLKARSLKPELLPFMPYSAAHIVDILSTKLRNLSSGDTDVIPFLHPAAIQFCAKKVASQTGDIRKAFDICRRAIDLVEQETNNRDAKLLSEQSPSKTPLMENINLSSPPTPRSPDKGTAPKYTVQTAPKATIAHVAKVTAQVFGNGTAQRLVALNLQQKAVLCSLAALEKQKRNSHVERTMFATPSRHNSAAPSIKQLYGTYSQLCKRENLLHPLTNAEFRDVVSGLESLGLLAGADGKGSTFAVPITPSRTPSRSGNAAFGTAAVSDEKRVASVVGQNELSSALEGPGGDLLRDILACDVVM